MASDNLLSADIEHPNLDVTEQVSSPPGELNGSATKLCSYPYKFHEIIERAKQLAQCRAALDPCPNRAWFVDEKGPVYVTEAIMESMEKGVFVPSGESLLLMMYASSQQTGYWPQYHKDLSTLVGLFTSSLHISRCSQLWEVLMTW